MRAIPNTAWRWALATAAFAAVALALVALESENAAAGGARASQAKAKRVNIANFAYHPKTLRIRRGTRVAFVNSSGVTHTATRAGAFDTGEIAPGGSVVVRFSHRGTFAYHCTIHPFMHGKIVVK